MRILMFTGKGGVGKTSLAAATGVKLAALNYRTLVMSIDPAHSLADSFDLENELFHAQTSDPLAINDKLSILELNIQKEIKRHWQEISSYVSSVLRTTGISGVEAEAIGLVNRAFDSTGELQSEVSAVARELASKSPLTLRGCKHTILYSRDHTVAEGLEHVALWNAGAVMSEDLVEAVRSQQEKRKPRFRD